MRATVASGPVTIRRAMSGGSGVRDGTMEIWPKMMTSKSPAAVTCAATSLSCVAASPLVMASRAPFTHSSVIWRVTPALHSPLMAVTNAVSSVIIVGALLAAGLKGLGAAQLFGAIAVALAAVNIFGGFIVTHRMLSMFKKKTPVKK